MYVNFVRRKFRIKIKSVFIDKTFQSYQEMLKNLLTRHSPQNRYLCPFPSLSSKYIAHVSIIAKATFSLKLWIYVLCNRSVTNMVSHQSLMSSNDLMPGNCVFYDSFILTVSGNTSKIMGIVTMKTTMQFKNFPCEGATYWHTC